jgi:hypothetical protein
MNKRWFVPAALIAAVIMVAAGFTLGGRSTVAQDMAASPTAGEEAHPAHIHLGTCDQLGAVVFPLSDVAAGDASATPMAGMDSTDKAEMMASPTAGEEEYEVVAWSESDVQAGLDEIIAGGHAVNVHESKANIQNYIACGEVTGTPSNGELVIELDELNDSGYEGEATLTDNGDGTTTVYVELFESDDDAMATPDASPTS